MPRLPIPRAASAAAVPNAITAALADCRGTLWSVAVFSAAVNLLMLAGPLYMLQVYDRVLTSHSIATLVALSALLCGAFALQATLDVIRGRLTTRSAALLDEHLSQPVHAAVIRLAVVNRSPGAADPVRDLDQVRAFLTGQGPIAMVDLPWVPVFLLLCGLIHPWLGLLALTGGAVLGGAALLTERATRKPTRDANQHVRLRSSIVEEERRNAETTAAMRLESTRAQAWFGLNAQYLAAVERSSDVVNLYAGLSKVTRMLIQSGALGLGAYLVIRQMLMPGAMIAASIMMARALAPIETTIANWRAFVAARDGCRRLRHTLADADLDQSRTALPKPQHDLVVENLAVAAPGATGAILNDICFAASAGEAVGVIGRSGCGKTSLLRALVGVWRPVRGCIRVDGAAMEQWSPQVIGPAIGYVSQAIDLFDGTVAENIARMAVRRDDDAVVAAAKMAGAHDMILRLAGGYDTRVGPGGATLSAGQRQRLALARALYGDPFLVVLDEPNANLDSDGEAALVRAMLAAKARGAIIVLVAHRSGILSICDKILVLADGVQHAFGPSRDLLRQPPPAAVAGKAPLKLVGASAEGDAS